MLISFEVENFRSFKTKKTFHTVQRNYKRFPHHLCKVNDSLIILKTSAIYGHNGSGKTNLFKAMYFVKRMVEDMEFLNSAESYKILTSFKLDNISHEKDSIFNTDFVIENNIYTYELRVNEKSKKITFEALKLTLEDILIFERKIDTEDNNIINFGDNEDLSKFGEIFLSFLPQDATLLSVYTKVPFFEKINNVHLRNVRTWFTEKLSFIFPIHEFSDITYLLSSKPQFLELANRIIKYGQTGIDSLSIKEVPLEIYIGEENKDQIDHIYGILRQPGKHHHSFKDSNGNYCTAINKVLADNKKQVMILNLVCNHLKDNGEEVPFELNQESNGTIVLLHLLPAIILSYGEGVNYFIDDINTCIHPILLYEILGQYLTNNIGEAKGQFIFNSHEDLLMDEKFFRQDEIWLTEKNKIGETDIFSLSDFSNVRFDLNLRKNYLNGKFGGVPYAKDPGVLNLNLAYEHG